MDLGLANRVVLVTGGSAGIGRAIVQAFAAEGARVAFTYHRRQDKADAVVATLAERQAEVMACQADLSSIDSIHAATEQIVLRWGRIDVLVNNAVAWGPRLLAEALPFEEVPVAEWQSLLRMNVEGAYAAIQAVLPGMKAQRWGRIVNVSSTIALDGLPGAGWYSAAKAALHGLSRTLAKELQPFGVLVNVVTPGPTLTERVGERMPWLARRQQAAATLLAPADVAPVVVFLGSAANTAVSGDVVAITGALAPLSNTVRPTAAVAR